MAEKTPRVPPPPLDDIEALPVWAKAHPEWKSILIRIAAERASELVKFLEAVALGKRKATAREIKAAQKELARYLPDLPDADT